MAVRFKFRSSAAFESVDLDGNPSISLRDLRSKILDHANLRLSRDFDLLISDALSGQPYEDEELRIAAGSSVIIKRIPTGRSAPMELANSKGGGLLGGTVSSSPSDNIDLDKFDDFGNELYPAFDEATLPESDDEVAIEPREPVYTPKCQNVDGSDLSDAVSKEIVGENCNDEGCTEEDKEIKMKSKIEEHQSVAKCSAIMLNMDLPMELKCFLCDTIFKEAVMIPCCQHSFCHKCIRFALVEMRKCPKCSSNKCTVEDLLPNLSLRQAIVHFLEAQTAMGGLDNLILPKYAPDGESGIQAKEASCAVSIRQDDRQAPHSPSVTGKGSNQIVTESARDNKRSAGIRIRLDADKPLKIATSFPKINTGNLRTRSDQNSPVETVKQMADVQETGDSTKLPHLPRKEEAGLPVQKWKELSIDGSGAFVTSIRHRKGDRTCYMCGSPNHLIRDCPGDRNCYMCGSPDHWIRDCPVASKSNAFSGDVTFPGFTSRGPSHWQGPTFHPFQPYANMYNSPAVIPFDLGVVPLSPFAAPSYVPSSYPGMTNPYGFMRMGGLPPPMLARPEQPLACGDFLDHGTMQKQKFFNEHGEREHDCDVGSEGYYSNETERKSHKMKHQSDSKMCGAHADKDNNQGRYRKQQEERYYSSARQKPTYASDEEIHCSVDRKLEKGLCPSASGRDRRSHCSEKPISEVHDVSDGSNQVTRLSKHSLHAGPKSEAVHNSKSHHHQGRKESTHEMERRHKHHDHSELRSGLDRLKDCRQISKEKESSQSSKHSKRKEIATDDWLESDRWEMVDGPNVDYRGDHTHRNRKRKH